MKLTDLIRKGSFSKSATATVATTATVAPLNPPSVATVAGVAVANPQKQAAQDPPVKSLEWLNGGNIGEHEALNSKLMTEAARICDHYGDGEKAREAMLQQIMGTPEALRADLLAYLESQKFPVKPKVAQDLHPLAWVDESSDVLPDQLPVEARIAEYRLYTALAPTPTKAKGKNESDPSPPGQLAPTEPQEWKVLAQAYHAHHFVCKQCQCAGRGAQYGSRCAVGMALWTGYTDEVNREPAPVNKYPKTNPKPITR